MNNQDWGKPKPKPDVAVPPGHQLVTCSKCSGTGLYVMAVIDGRPWSATGTTCWSCGGTGWKVRKPRRKRCPRCRALCNVTSDGKVEPHSFYRNVDGELKVIQCTGNEDETE